MALATSTYLAIAAVAVAGATSYEAGQQAKAAAKKEEEAKEVAGAEQQAQQMQQTRAQIREERVRRAQILQASESTGVTGSSGALGSIGALKTNIGSNVAAASRQANAATAITGLQQKAADLRTDARETQAMGSLISSGLSIGANFASAPAAPTPTTPTVQPGGFSPATQPNPYDTNNLFR